jgi:superfamily I DNA/RNA helicase
VDFRIAETLTTSLGRLTAEEQKAAKTTAFDLQMNPSGSGMQFHRLDKARDKNFWSVRVSSDLRMIVHRTEGSVLLCYVGHHDDAYCWAERRKIEVHPRTGAAQIVEIREIVREVGAPQWGGVAKGGTAAPSRGQSEPPSPRLFVGIADSEFLNFGVPVEWLGEVREATEWSLFDVAQHLPAEAAEALLQLATSGADGSSVLAGQVSGPRKPGVAVSAEGTGAAQAPLASRAPTPPPLASRAPALPPPPTSLAEAFSHPDAQRRFRVVADVEELERALAAPWEKWIVFLHPAQRELVEREFNGPARVAGSAGTGKTIVALHRAVHLARTHPEARVLLATFSEPLARALEGRMKRLLGNQPRLAERLEVHSMAAIAERLYQANFGPPELATNDEVRQRIAAAAGETPGHQFSEAFLWGEWRQVVDAWQLATWEAYRDVARLGRKTRLAERHRAVLWSIFERVRRELAEAGQITVPGMFERLTEQVGKAAQEGRAPFDFAVIDEAQDISVAELRFLAALGGGRPNSLFFAGDLGQRIFQVPFSWRSLGVDLRGRSHSLRVNYRTSHQIRRVADRLLSSDVADVDGIVESRTGTNSVFNGPEPEVRLAKSEEEETRIVADWLKTCAADGVEPHELAVFARSDAELGRARAAVRLAGLEPLTADGGGAMRRGTVTVGTMHLAKGLEFRAVAVMACDDEVLPLQSRIENVVDGADLEDVYDTERHLLYVACTRARDRLLVSGVGPGSEFLEDLSGGAGQSVD